ncbi:oligosaccharide flippase family protein [candidate division WOR-3 bacterium]|nr:oligosaccharide flippase family protein [candidate division WOR-3 bacterium]
MKLSEFKGLSKDTLVYGIGNASDRIIRFVLLPLYSAYLPIESYGIRNLTIPLYEVLKIIILLSIEEAVIADYYKAKTLEERRSVISTGFTFSVITSLLIGGLTYIFAAPLAQLMGISIPDAPAILRLFAVLTALSPPSFVFLSFLRCEKRAGIYTVFSVTKSLIKVGLMVVFLMILKRGLIGTYEVDAILTIVFFVPVIIIIYVYSRGIQFSFKKMKSMFKYALPLVPNRAFLWIHNMLDRWLIKPVLGEAGVGVYGFVVNFSNLVSFLLVATVNLAWLPYAFSIRERPDFPKTISRILTYVLLIGGWSLLVLGGSARELVQLIAKKPEYWEGYFLAPILVLGVCLYGAYVIISTPCHTERKTGAFMSTSLVGAAVIVLINVIFLPRIGIFASALASFFSYLVMFVMMFFLSRRLMKIPHEIKRIIIIGLTSVVITGACFLWHPFYPPVEISAFTVTPAYFYWHPLAPLLGFLLKLSSATIAYFLTLAILGFLCPEEVSVIKRFLLKKKESRNTQ